MFDLLNWSDSCQRATHTSVCYIRAICSSCIYHIRDLRRIRRHLDLESAKLLANALVSRRVDYCNSTLSGIAETDFTKLQRILNSLARVVTKSPPFTRSVPLLRSLHWIPVKYRVHFKVCLLTYKALHEEQPIYHCFSIATNIPGIVKLSGATSKSVLNSKIDEAVTQHQQVIGHAGVYKGNCQVKKICLERFPEGGN